MRRTLGAQLDAAGVRFSLFTSRADAVEVCLFDGAGRETARHALQRGAGGIWRVAVPGCGPGQRYGYRVHGPWAPDEGLRCNPAKLLLDPYARALEGAFTLTPALYDFRPDRPGWELNPEDSAACVPKCVVTGELPRAGPGPGIPWAEMVVYEANVRGYTMRAPGLEEAERGRFRGMANGAILGHLKALGVTAVELMPVHALMDEPALLRRGRRNLWGYNPIQYFTPDLRYAERDPNAEFVDMVHAIHDAGLEVILDVVYNHTAESDARGPCLSFRGIDNLAYYRAEDGDPGVCVNDSGCGNTLDADHPAVQDLVMDSLVHWHRVMGVDGFRFDLATVLGRSRRGFDPAHPLLVRIATEPELAGAKRVAEPWDPGPGGYQLGRFPPPFAELNGRFRDAARAFWGGGEDCLGELARRLHGSADLFEAGGRPPLASVNFVANHDGLTLWDLAATLPGDARRQRLNLLATLLFSHGIPLLLAGDEFGNTQGGNANAYDEDNETGWTGWGGLDADPEFTARVRELIALRRRLPLLRSAAYAHDVSRIEWLHPGGGPMQPAHWSRARALVLLVRDGRQALAVLLNGAAGAVEFRPPGDGWRLAFSSADLEDGSGGSLRLQGYSVALLEALAPG